jgi:DNA-binding transcriptional LysR family regulator
MRPSLNHLEVFLAIVDAGSFRAAAARLRCTQSSVSYAVSQLEKALDRVLFERTGARPRLTPEGEAIAAQARVVLGEVHRLELPATPAAHEAPRAPLHVAVDIMVAPKVLVPLLLEATHRLPGVELRVRTESRYSLIELLAEGGCEVALSGSGAAVPAGLTREPLQTFALVPVVAPSHALASVAKPDRAMLAEAMQITTTERSEAGRRQPLENALSTRFLRVTEVALKLELLRGGLGWGFLPWDFVEADVRAGRLVQLRAPRPDVGTLALLYRTRSGPTAFGELVRERLAPRPRARRLTRQATRSVFGVTKHSQD